MGCLYRLDFPQILPFSKFLVVAQSAGWSLIKDTPAK